MPASSNTHYQKGFAVIIILLAVLIVGAVGFVIYKSLPKKTLQDFSQQLSPQTISGKNNPFSSEYSQGKCEGNGTVFFTHSPMNLEDIGSIEPYGLMADAHVIPTSHGYISPINFHSARDAYPVYAIADGTIVFVAHRGQFIGDGKSDKVTDEYQMYFEHSCSFYSYYDLLTSISSEIEKEVGKLTGFDTKYVRIPIKAGQLVGRVGGQTVDFAVWNFDKEPAFFSNPKSYQGDENRFYLEDMFSYFNEPIKSDLMGKNSRQVEPRTGKVAYDIEGKLIGNWFKQGSGGFRGIKEEQGADGRYWNGHLAIVYDYIDPSQIKFSIGNFEGKAAQFNVAGNNPNPAAVGVESGKVMYELVGPATQNSPPEIKATVLMQLIEPEKLKLELFPGKTKDQVSEFTSSALIYER